MRVQKLLTLLILVSLSTGCNTNQPDTSSIETTATIDLVEDLGLTEEPIKLSDNVYYLGVGIPAEELNIVKPSSFLTPKIINAAKTIKTDKIWFGSPLNLKGEGFVVGVWEAGEGKDKWAVAEHERLEGRVKKFGNGQSSNHATAVAGIIAATGEPLEYSTGMAQGVRIKSYPASNDLITLETEAEQTTKQEPNWIVASNHSYGLRIGWEFSDIKSLKGKVINDPNITKMIKRANLTMGGKQVVPVFLGNYSNYKLEFNKFGKYEAGKAEDIDRILNNHPHLISVWAAGNFRDDGIYGSDCYIVELDKESSKDFWKNKSMAKKGKYLLCKTSAFLNGDSPSKSNEHYWWYGFPKEPPPGSGEYFEGYRTISTESATKNGIVVGAVDKDKKTTVFSGWGPTDTGRIKPDVVGNGVLPGLLSASNDYYQGSGTSFSAPSVTGTAVLLVEHFRNLWTQPESLLKQTTKSERPFSATIKALLIHTAENLGQEGPDYQFGWGLVDAKAAADFLTAANQPESGKSLRETVYEQEEQTIQVIGDGTKPLKVTIVWTDPPGRNLINDLDLWVTEQSESGSKQIHYPWNLEPKNPSEPAIRKRKNKLDNVEQVLIKKPKKDATYTIHIGGQSSSQNYSLLMEGVMEVEGLKDGNYSYIYTDTSENWRMVFTVRQGKMVAADYIPQQLTVDSG